jgi:hypothetical protein
MASETRTPKIPDAVLNGKSTRAIDFPGLDSSQGRDLQHCQALTTALRQMRTVHVIAVVFNFNDVLDQPKLGTTSALFSRNSVPAILLKI